MTWKPSLQEIPYENLLVHSFHPHLASLENRDELGLKNQWTWHIKPQPFRHTYLTYLEPRNNQQKLQIRSVQWQWSCLWRYTLPSWSPGSRVVFFHMHANLAGGLNLCQKNMNGNGGRRQLQRNCWLVVYLPLWKIWTSIGMMTFPIYGKINRCSKPPNRIGSSFPCNPAFLRKKAPWPYKFSCETSEAIATARL